MVEQPQSLPQQPLVLLLAFLFWSLVGSATWLAAVICYLLALVVLNFVWVWCPSAVAITAGTIAQRRLLFVVLWLAIAASAGPMLLGLNLRKQWSTARESVADRLTLEKLPAISPPLLVSYEPQRFTIYAPGSQEVKVRWTPKSPTLAATDLGHGLFWLDFDPRTDPALATLSADKIDCEIIADRTSHSRELNFVRAWPHPRQVRSSPAVGLAATVSEETDELVLIRRDGSCQRVPVGDGPTDCALIDNGKRIVVAHRFTPELWIVNGATGDVETRTPNVSHQTRLAVSRDNQWLAVAQQGAAQGIRFYQLPELKESKLLPLDWSPDLLEFAGSAESERLVVTDRRGRTLRRIVRDGDWWSVLEENEIKFARPITATARTPNADQVALATTASQWRRDSYFSDHTADRIEANHFIENTVHLFDAVNWHVVATQVTDRRGLHQDSPGDTEHGISPLAMATINGNRLMAAFTGSNEVAIEESENATGTWFSLDPFPLFAPQGLGDLGNGFWCVTSPSDGTIGIFDHANQLQSLQTLTPNENELQRLDPAALLRRHGERTFFEGTRAGIACQSCHLDAATDFCQHNIGQRRPVDVLSVRGISGTSPYLRDASHWRLQDLHELAVVGYRDFPRNVPWDRAKALAAYLNSLPPQPHPLASEKFELTRLKNGVSAFFQAGCATCHTPPAFTNLGQHSAVSLFPDYYGPKADGAGTDDFLDTPSLRGVALTPPYLHHGRAATLREVLVERNSIQRHGNTKSLSPEQLADLVFLLERL